MKTLSNIKQAGKLRKKTDLEPVKRNVTRWSSTYEMLKRFFEIKTFIDDEDPDLACNLPSGIDWLLTLGTDLLQLQKLLKDLEQFENIAKQLQDPITTLSDVRAIFDQAIEEYETLSFYLKADATIVHSPEFESAIVKVMDDAVAQLTEEEAIAITCFRQSAGRNVANASDDDELTIVQKALKNKRRKVVHGEYLNLNFVPPTSNVVERLFSNARLVLTDYRKSMTPYTFECVMFLKINRNFWDLDLVAKIVEK